MSGELTLEVSSSLENLEKIGNFIESSMKQLGVEQAPIIYKMQLAVDEACTNIMKHAYKDKEGPIKITCFIKDNDLRVVIKDWGNAFNPEDIPEPDTDAPLDQRKVGGLGLFLMKSFVDRVKYTFDSKEGNELLMVKNIGNESK